MYYKDEIIGWFELLEITTPSTRNHYIQTKKSHPIGWLFSI